MSPRKFDNVTDIQAFLLILMHTPEWINLQGKSQVFDEANNGIKTRGAHSTDVGLVASQLIDKMRK